MVSLKFLVTRDNRTEVMKKVLDWLMEGQKSSLSIPMSLRSVPSPSEGSRAKSISSPSMGEDQGEGDIPTLAQKAAAILNIISE